jgi:MFS transporter, ACS family, hexuronate transporter
LRRSESRGATEVNLSEKTQISRWTMAAFLSAAIGISYLDRQTLPVAVHAISHDIPLSNAQFSTLQSAFLISYAFMYAAGGKLIDVLGTCRGFTLIMIFWSLACATHSLALTFAMLLASRFLLGVGEGGSFPAATKAIAEWFPTEERATAMGFVNAGGAVGAMLAPPLIAAIVTYLNWRWIFVVTATFGLFWTLWWARSTNASNRNVSHRIISESQQEAGQLRLGWIDLLRIRECWALVMAKFLSDAAWYFYLFWLPKYLYDARGFDIKRVGAYAWIPSAAAGVGCVAGGCFSSYLVRRQFGLGRARKLALGLSAVVMPFIILVPHVAVSWAIALFTLAYFGQQSWSTLVMVLPTDLFPRAVVGSVAGLVGFGGAMGGIVFGQLVGYLLDRGFGYSFVFSAVGTFHGIAFLVILLAIPVLRPKEIERRFSFQGIS